MSNEEGSPPYDPDRILTSAVTHRAPDGTRLSGRIFRPEDVSPEAPAPVLLQRTPYGKPDEPPTEGFAARAIASGYVLAYEDTRGRGGSGGEFRPWVHEAADGASTIEWLSSQPWATTVGMFGGSSPGQVQLFAASEGPDGLGAIAPTFTPSDLHRADFFQDGALSAMTFLTWSFDESVAGHTIDRLVARNDLDAETAEAARATFQEALADLDGLVRHRPLIELPSAMLSEVALPTGIEPADLVPHWREWLTRPTYDDFWASFDPERFYDRIEVPGLHTTGWYELCQEGTITNFAGLRRDSNAPQHLVIGPWAHQYQGRTIGAVDFGPAASAAAYGRTEQLLAFFETYLRDRPTPPFDDPGRSVIETFRARVMPGKPVGSQDARVAGTGTWIRHDDWPPADARLQRWYLHSDGEATEDPDDGVLSPVAPIKAEPPDRWAHDPADPVPTRGGPLCCGEAAPSPGPFDRRDIQDREDVLTFTTPPLEATLDLVGPVSLRATVATAADDADVVAVLSHVTDGGAFNLCEGIRRLQYRHGRDRSVPVTPGEPTTVAVNLWSVHYRLPAGDRLRLEVASSNAPRFDPHPGTMDPWRADAAGGPAEQTLFHERDRESVLTTFARRPSSD